MTEPPSAPTRVLVISGPSGAGKTTVVARLEELNAVPLVKSVSATTRPPRPHERDGHDYRFLTDEEFHAARDRGEFLETAEVFGRGYWYGTLVSEVERAAAGGAWCLLEIDVAGARAVREKFPDAVLVFLETATLAEFERRLRDRGTETEETIERRLAVAREELAAADAYDHRIINDEVDRAAGEIAQILKDKEAEIDARRV
ncbi:MAG: guanylate kinase [Planctomycetota bacterium]